MSGTPGKRGISLILSELFNGPRSNLMVQSIDHGGRWISFRTPRFRQTHAVDYPAASSNATAASCRLIANRGVRFNSLRGEAEAVQSARWLWTTFLSELRRPFGHKNCQSVVGLIAAIICRRRAQGRLFHFQRRGLP